MAEIPFRDNYPYEFNSFTKAAITPPVVITSVNPSFTEILSVTMTDAPVGDYTITLSNTSTMADTNDSYYFRASINGVLSDSMADQPSDTTNINSFDYTATYSHTVAGDIAVIMEGAISSGGQDLNVEAANLIIECKVRP